MQKTQTLLVTGAAGQLGRRVLELLLERQTGPIIATTRRPDPLADFAARGVDVRKADFDDPATLPAAFAGAERMLLISTDAVGEPGKRVAQHRAAIAAAKRAGVKHVVYTSVAQPEPPTPVLVSPDHWGTEQALAESGLSWTALRNNLYTDLLLGTLPDAAARGQLFAAAGDGGAAFVTREDCAQAAAAVLASSDTASRAYEITGPAAVTYAEIAARVGELTGRPVTYVSLTPEALKAGMLGAGLPEGLADLLVSFGVGIAQGKLAPASTAVRDLTGREPISVAAFLAQHREALLSAA